MLLPMAIEWAPWLPELKVGVKGLEINVSRLKKTCALPEVPTIMCENFKLMPFIIFEFYAHRVTESVKYAFREIIK